MSITLSEALPIRASIVKHIHELNRELQTVSTITYQKGDRYLQPESSVEDVLADIRKASRQQMTLDAMIAEANQTATIEWDGEQIKVALAIEEAKMLRTEVKLLKELAARRKEKISGYSSILLITTTTYEPADYRMKAMQVERKVNKLSSLIDRVNLETVIDFDASDYFGE